MPCEKCNNRGYKLSDSHEFLGFCDCPLGVKHKRAFWERSLANAGIFSEYWYKTMRDFYPQLTPKHAEFVTRTGQTIGMIDSIHKTSFVWVIYGDTGTGKTLAANLVLIEAARKGYTSRYIVWSDLLAKRFNHDAEDQSLEDIKNVDFLTIDEVNGDTFEKAKFPAETLELILKYRYSNQKPTILVLKHDLNVVSRRLPVLGELISPANVSAVEGLNYRTASQPK